ncbi:unnamed protein product [Schistosoma turkestanicum]|nr:unnamed protein product [Schistosoma turkestanicum]
MSNRFGEETNHFHDYSGRHNPHPQRVTCFTGFLGLPVRVIHDPIVTDGTVSSTQRNDSYDASSDLRKRTNFPIGLSSSYYTDYLVNNSSKLNFRNTIQNDSLDKSWRSNAYVHHVPVGILPLSLNRRKIPQLDTINGLKYFTGLRNYSVRARPPLLGALMESEVNHSKILRQSHDDLTDLHHGSLLNKELSERRTKWQSELSYLAGSILSGRKLSTRLLYYCLLFFLFPALDQLQIPIPTDKNNHDQPFDRFNNSYNRNNNYYYPLSSFMEKTSSRLNNHHQPIETMHKNQNSSGELLYSSKTGRLMPSTNDSRYIRTRNQTSSSSERGQYLKHATSVNEMFRNYEMQIFAMICRILQTNDTNAVQHWLENATDREKNLIINLVSTALYHQNMYYDTKQAGSSHHPTNSDMHWSRREKLSNNDVSLNETVEDENCCTETDRLVIDETDNIREIHSRGIQVNLSDDTCETTLKSNNTEVNKATNTAESFSLCQTPLKPNWKQHESIGIP